MGPASEQSRPPGTHHVDAAKDDTAGGERREKDGGSRRRKNVDASSSGGGRAHLRDDEEHISKKSLAVRSKSRGSACKIQKGGRESYGFLSLALISILHARK